ncbi:MAG: hypothetical protein EPO25_06800 [Gammaproteobacteria bacterium]|nr:MAG: hypothetical protein EPO25_06800 [Gammaproteobacteria bacterium]
MLKFVTVAAALLVIAGPVCAGTPGLDQRQHNQAQRIRQGVHSGELTRHEAGQLVHGQVQLRRIEARAKADGIVTARERIRLQHRADVQSRQIYRQKHDGQQRE